MYTRGVWGEIEVVQRLVSGQRIRARHGTPHVLHTGRLCQRPFDTTFLLDFVRAKRTDALHPTASFRIAVGML